jgi:hypothetical protein
MNLGDGAGNACTEKIIMRAQEIIIRDEDMNTALHITRETATLRRTSSVSLETTAASGSTISIGTREDGFTESVSVTATDIFVRAAQTIDISTVESDAAIHIGIHQPINQSINQPINQSTNQSINQSINCKR